LRSNLIFPHHVRISPASHNIESKTTGMMTFRWFGRVLLVEGLLVLAADAGRLELTRARALQGACAALAVPALALEAYARAPPRWSNDELPQATLPAGVTRLCIVIPGSAGADENTARIVSALRDGSTAVLEVDWRRFGSDDQLRAPYNARRIGRALGESLARQAAATNEPPTSVHVVAVSAGAFLADALVVSFADTFARSAGGRPRPHLRLTFCDAFTAVGLPGLVRPSTAYGVRRFGERADYTEAFINTDDPVPSTSLPLRELCENRTMSIMPLLPLNP
jgi:hypothetical protein